MIMLRSFILSLLVVFSATAFALDHREDAEVEARLKHLSNELRCLVCQNSTLSDSDAPLAQDLRNEIRKMIIDGKTDDEIIDFLVQRYGDFVRFRPPVNANTALLWFGPFVMLLIGMGVLVFVLKKRATAPDTENDT